jgi:hypothetical protein
MNRPAGRSRPIVREIATFATIGIASTIAYLALYSLFRAAASPPIANALGRVTLAAHQTDSAASQRLLTRRRDDAFLEGSSSPSSSGPPSSPAAAAVGPF